MKLRLYDIFGRMKLEIKGQGENTTTLDLSHLLSGVYFIFNYR
jgi:hypothetical protein